jgi:hypothetical protein
LKPHESSQNLKLFFPRLASRTLPAMGA